MILRKINKITKYEAYPLPLLTDVLSSLEGNRYFSTLDATKSFWSFPIKEEDQEKTQFATPFGSYCFTRMAMGLKNASQHYCRVMDLLLGSLKYEVAMSFVDDLIVYSKTFDEHLNNLQKVFARVEEFGIRLNAKKCKFLSEEVKFLGHIITPHGIKTCPEKVKAITEVPWPKKIKELRSFLGMASYYRKFQKNFAKTAEPLTSLLRKGARVPNVPCNRGAETSVRTNKT